MTPATAEATLLLLDKDAVEQLLAPAEVTQVVREAFLLHGRREGRVFPVVREKLASGGIFGIKSGDVPSQGLLGFKAAGFWPRNRELGGEPHQATGGVLERQPLGIGHFVFGPQGNKFLGPNLTGGSNSKKQHN